MKLDYNESVIANAQIAILLIPNSGVRIPESGFPQMGRQSYESTWSQVLYIHVTFEN